MNFNCLIIDDEPLARKVLEKHLIEFPQFSLAGSFDNALTAFEFLNKKNIDLIFLDIQLPGIGGLEFIKSLKNPPLVVFVTAYSEYAAESYNLDAVDYLVKPVSFERFTRCIDKFFKQTIKEEKEEVKTFLFIKENGKLVKLFFKDIVYIESRKDYLKIHTSDGNLVTHMTMKSMEELLPIDSFKRIHRSFIVSTDKVNRIGTDHLELANKKLPLGEKYKKEILQYFKKE